VDYNLALLERADGDHGAAAERLAAVLERNPDRLHVRRELARSRMDAGGADLEETRLAAEAALAADEHDWRAWELLGDVERLRQDHQAAQAYYTKALEWGSKSLGFSPPHLEDKYREVATRLQEELREQGLLPEEARPGGAPPLPEGVLERRREAAREAREG
jgi:tetratricopeptide (TPR) repeat protein